MNLLPYDLPTNPNSLTFIDPCQIAKRLNPEDPIQCFSVKKLRHRISLFLNNFPGDVAYAVKANPSALVIKESAAAGISTFDVASIAEMELVNSIAPAAKLHYHNPVKSDREICQAEKLYNCRRFAVDDYSQLRKIVDIIGNNENIEIAVRFRLPSRGDSIHDFSEKFGLAPVAAAHLLAQVSLCGYKPLLTFHPGSQCMEPDSWERHIDAAAQIVKSAGVRLYGLNVGGGFPVDYASLKAPDLRAFFDQIQSATNSSFGAHNAPSLECEPGRAIIAPAVSVLTRVKFVRNSSAEVYLNDGIYGNLMEATQTPLLQPQAFLIRNGKYVTSELKPFIIYGPTCDPLDRLPNSVLLPLDIKEDDYVVFQSLGAYACATSTRFNGYGQCQTLQVQAT